MSVRRSTHSSNCACAWLPTNTPAACSSCLCIAGVRLQDDLKLCVPLDAVGIVSIAAVIWAYGWLRVGNAPGFRAQHTVGDRTKHKRQRGSVLGRKNKRRR